MLCAILGRCVSEHLGEVRAVVDVLGSIVDSKLDARVIVNDSYLVGIAAIKGRAAAISEIKEADDDDGETS